MGGLMTESPTPEAPAANAITSGVEFQHLNYGWDTDIQSIAVIHLSTLTLLTLLLLRHPQCSLASASLDHLPTQLLAPQPSPQVLLSGNPK